jgi:formiminoglutamate deiminase
MQIIHADQALTATGWQQGVELAIGEDGRIARVSTQQSTPDTKLDLALPAPVNLHSHAFQRAMSGLTEQRGPDPSDSFWTWRLLMYRFLDRLTPEHVQAISALVFMEMLEAGYSAVAEFHYLHHGPDGTPYDDLGEMSARIIASAKTAGIGLTHLPVLYQQGGCDGRALQGGQRRFGNNVQNYVDLHQRARVLLDDAPADFALGVAPHSLRAVSQDSLKVMVELAGDGPIHMHLAEQIGEVEAVSAHYGARPVEWLLDNHNVDDRWCLIHCTQMNAQETSALAKTGAVAGLCPITESSLGDGIFNGTDYLVTGGHFGVGSDSNIHIALFEELATLEYSQRLRDRSRAALALPGRSVGRVLLESVAAGGAQAAGRASGTLAVGQQADILGIQIDNEWLCNRKGDTALDSLIVSGHGRDCISDVWSAGRHMVQNGRHIRRDDIVTKFLATMGELGQDI